MKKIIVFLSIALVMPFGVQAAKIDSINSFAWGENIGWIDFVHSELTQEGILGYAWGENVGWISLNCLNTDCDSVAYGVTDSGSGDITGYAWGENIGWIDFEGVSIDEQGNFYGYAYSPNVGHISFNCLNTDTCEDIAFKVSLESENNPVDTNPGDNDDNPETVSTSTPSVSTRSGSRRISGSRATDNFVTSINNVPQGSLASSELITGPQENQPEGSLYEESRLSSTGMDLKYGMTHENVKRLQKLLNSLGYTIAQSGPGSSGNETNYFGPLTRSALVKFQADNNVTPSVGYFGPKTRALLALKGF